MENRTCETCENAIAAGEGDHICTEKDGCALVIEGYGPGDEYLWCGGELYE